MGYKLKKKEKISKGLKRILEEQIDKVVDEINNPKENIDETVHEIRKRFKKIRTVIRLLRDEIGKNKYKEENLFYRDEGRRIAGIRDSFVLEESLNKILNYYAHQLISGAFENVKVNLEESHKSFKAEKNYKSEINEIKKEIITAKERIIALTVKGDDFKLISDGLQRIYKRGKKGIQNAYQNPIPENFHEWRKRVKYLRYSIKAVSNFWPDELNQFKDSLHNLTDFLGEIHDLLQLKNVLLSNKELCRDETQLQMLLALINQRTEELKILAKAEGERIYAEKPKAFIKRINNYYKAFKKND